MDASEQQHCHHLPPQGPARMSLRPPTGNQPQHQEQQEDENDNGNAGLFVATASTLTSLSFSSSPPMLLPSSSAHTNTTCDRATRAVFARALVLLVAASFISALLYFGGQETRLMKNGHLDVVHIAHMGNSFQFVNDLPRVLETMGQGRIYQDSVLHGSLTFVSLLRRGNGMYKRWKTNAAYNETTGFYDYGACSMNQLLLGYDEKLYDFDTYYYDDGKNPCAQDQDYLAFRDAQQQELLQQTARTTPKWDYVVMNDQSVTPTIYQKRLKSADALKKIYAPVLQQIWATPILIQTWAYDADEADNHATMDVLIDIPTFTSLLVEGYELYFKTLSAALPSQLQPRIAPVGLAYLTIWEENYSFWKNKMFAADLFHPSPHGSYLEACVVYITIFGRAPDPPSSQLSVESLYNRSRARQISGDVQLVPTDDEALYLRWIAQRVTLKGHVPSSLREAQLRRSNDDGE